MPDDWLGDDPAPRAREAYADYFAQRLAAPRAFAAEAEEARRAARLTTPSSTRSGASCPSVERGEALNVGVVVFCRRRRFLAARILLDEPACARSRPASTSRRCAATSTAWSASPRATPPAARSPRCRQSERFGWLTAASSTIVQPSPIHTGLCGDPQAVLDRLYRRLVAAE